MSLALQSRGRAVAELQVCGARGQLSRRRRRLALSLSVHSLLLVDALQTYGPDFEILVASHRSVTVDSVSGSLLDSEPCSPCSPGSPEPLGRPASPVSLTRAINQRLQTAAAIRVASASPPAGASPPPEQPVGHAQDALITLDVSIVLPSTGQHPSHTLQTVSVRFNTLDVIANQETIVELAGFLNRISLPRETPADSPPVPTETQPETEDGCGRTPEDRARTDSPPASPPSSRTELTFDFHKLNVLLLRSVRIRHGSVTGRKVATATVSGARIQATLAAQLCVSGALGGLQVRDLSPGGHRHPCVLSVGFDPVVEQSQDLLRRLNADLYRDSEQCPRALEFTACRPAGADQTAQLQVRLASVCYTHRAPFLAELGDCVDEFEQYITELARSVGLAAAEMAREMVHIRADPSGSGGDTGAQSPPRPDAAPPPDAGHAFSDLDLSVVLETPIVVVPESVGGSRVLVAHLGRIALASRPGDQQRLDVRDMNLYSLDLDRVLRARDLSPRRAFTVLRADELYDARLCGDPILYDTALEVDGQFVTPVRLSVLKSQYEQILRTLDQLTVPPVDEDTEPEPGLPAHGPGSTAAGADDSSAEAPPERKISVPAQNQVIPIHGSFQLSEFEMELRSDMGGGEARGLVTLTFSDLAVAYERLQPDLTSLQVTLQEVTMEDLLQPPDAPHRYLMASHNTPSERRLSSVSAFLSTSCPDIAAASADSALIQCTATLRGARAAVARTVDVNFNCLDVVVSPQSWVMVLDFFGGPPQPDTAGHLGALALVDLTRHGALYRERFVTSGPEAVHFDLVRYQAPDPGLQRPFDLQLRLHMASVLYVHTQRFLTELLQFCAHFTQLQELLSRLQAGSDVELSSRGSRVSLDVQAGAPVLLLPLSARSPHLLVADLGRLRVTNAFVFSGAEPPDSAARDIPFSRRAAPRGRISPVLKGGRERPASPDAVPCLLDVMEVTLSDMDVYSRAPTDLQLGSYLVRPASGGRLLKQKAGLSLLVERNLDAALNHDVPDMSVRGSLSTLSLSVDLPQYRLIRGLLDHNLGEPVELEPATLIQPHHVQVTAPDSVWLTMSVRLDLENVSLELVSGDAPLARVDFIRSQLLYESFSDASKDVDLMSREIRLYDARFTDFPANKRSNVFSLILQPLFVKTERSLQAELHYRASAEHAQFTVLLNSMRLMGVLDWWREVNEFISASPEGGFGPAQAAPTAPAPNAGMAVSAGVVTRRAAVLGQPQQSLELKLNVSDCELVLVENPTLSDSAAVILKATACVQYRPQSREKPLSCELQNCELFSCLLGGAEQETALSIVDPATVNVEVSGKLPADAARGILDATDTELHCHMEVLVQQLNVRVSYHDMKMFAAILESLPRQTAGLEGHRSPQPVNMQAPLLQLRQLGFSEADCGRALVASQGRLDEAAIWLTQHASPSTEAPGTDPPAPSQPLFDLRGVKLHTSSFSICIIDDCGDADVPLAELCMNHLSVSHSRDGSGEAACELSGDYYNRALSGWEPFLEPFKCELDWRHSALVQSGAPGGRRTAVVRSRQQANLNLTSTLLELYSMVRANWTEDYYNRHRVGGPRVASRRRSPFVPFSLKNDTGSRLRFRTVLTSFSGGADAATPAGGGQGGWTDVEVDQTLPFTFGGRGKLRHQDTHTTRQHQLLVWVEGWQPTAPVSVDRVGVYFRLTSPVPGRHPTGVRRAAPAPPGFIPSLTRRRHAVRQQCFSKTSDGVMCAVNVELMFRRFVPAPARVVFAVTLLGAARKLVTVRSALLISNRLPDPVEVKMESSSQRLGEPALQVAAGARRPVPLALVHAAQTARPVARPDGWSLCRCRSWQLASHVYRFCVSVDPDNYPSEEAVPCPRQPVPGRAMPGIQPGHTVSLLPPVTVVNLLPCELRFSCTGTDGTHRIEPGRQVDLEQDLLLTLSETGEQAEAAGQEADHERARSVSPLLFSLSDPEAPAMMVARLGRGQHVDGVPRWCHHFHLQPDLHVRRLRVAQRDSRRPDWVYVVGIEIRPGRGRYSDTNIITISPRFQIDNRSTHQLLFSQLHFADSFMDRSAERTWLRAMPRSQMAFHWPRHDCDHLLCVKLADVPDCHWSGGFLIDRTDSCHVNIRDKDSQSRFLRLEVVLQVATFYVVFMDADAMPPPFRVDNFSEVNVTFYQSGTQDHHLRSTVRPRSSVPYAWDQPLAKSLQLTVVAPGGQADAFDMNQLNQRKPLRYDNFMFIAFAGTFGGPSGAAFDPQNVECRQLVLDVVDGNVVLKRKEPGVRSQLWRHLSSGHVVHEGSSPPRDPRHPDLDTDRLMVLDIATPAIQPYERVPLRLRRLDRRRRLTQSWRFTDDGRLCCQHPNLYVQAQDGFAGLRRGSQAVLGPVPSAGLAASAAVPPEQAIQPQMQWPGSGQLSVRIVTDGPTRVLQLTDAQAKAWVVVGENNASRLLAADDSPEERPPCQTELTVSLQLPAGLGVSLVSSSPPAELLFVYLGDIAAEYRRTAARHALATSAATCRPSAFAAHAVPSACQRVQIFEHLVVSVKDLTVTLEERLLYHLLHFIGYSDDASEVNQLEESDLETQRALKAATSSHNTRYYCRRLELALKKVRLSVLTSARLRPELAATRDKLGRRLVQFEGAQVELDPFVRCHPFETAAKLIDSVLEHYKAELRSQAAIILGSFDFLGNPLGFFSDVSEGVSGLVMEGDLGALVKNVTHGVANSTAKVTGSISDAVGWATLDEKHDDKRRRIRSQHTAGSEDHLLAGLKGFGYGLWGGASSLVVQPIQGASNEGVWGFLSGIGKGIVGTVTKPAVGFLDLATGAANAVKDTSSSSSRQAPPRIRPIRVVQGAGGLLPRYSSKDGDGQELLETFTDRRPEERFVAYELLCAGSERLTLDGSGYAVYPELLSCGDGDLRVLISTEMVRVLSHSRPGVFTLGFAVHFSELEECRPSIERDPAGGHIYKVVLTVAGSGAGRKHSQPSIKCQDSNVAISITELINFGKSCYEELKHTVPPSKLMSDQQ
ncbi:LOW QUALITY PROTEIN: vacuolar protein sorting-associated protein 13D-like [Pollicipes pollicipes]|uniref:LOW QUALITY PROTEIN: vacuolar protein sorting-associated protein 13D-like n=1 Tax=Pollicipes pollicipes TaxID=41117 RepID=UPI001884CA84|nr:LOW QUALITY PROTEIN: vacuolar protein sorting-associated protein 13D-like [Pollicipes pollicipes]